MNHVKIFVSSLYRDEILFSIKIHGFSKCLSVLYKKNHIWIEKKISSLYSEETTMVYVEE